MQYQVATIGNEIKAKNAQTFPNKLQNIISNATMEVISISASNTSDFEK